MCEDSQRKKQQQTWRNHFFIVLTCCPWDVQLFNLIFTTFENQQYEDDLSLFKVLNIQNAMAKPDSRLALSHTGIKQVLLLEIQLFKMSTLRTVSFFLCLLSVHGNNRFKYWVPRLYYSTEFLFYSHGIVQLNQLAQLRTDTSSILPAATSILNVTMESLKIRSVLMVCYSTQRQLLSDSLAITPKK